MATKKFIARLHWQRGWKGEDQFTVYMSDMSDHGCTMIAEQEFEFPLPEKLDPVPLQLAALNKAEQKVRAEFASRITELQRQRNELMAIEMTVDAA